MSKESDFVDLLNKEMYELKIANLEAKLAESEEEHELLIYQFEEETEKLRKQIKQESDARKRFVEEVKNLKQQLAEKDLTIENWQTMYESVVQTCHNDKEEIERLNKQLAEKDKEIEKYRNANMIIVGRRGQGKKHLMQIKIKELQNQKAIEQLEQIINLFEPYENEEKDTILCANNGISFLEYIDNQINELKGKVE